VGFELLGRIAPRELRRPREQAHHAVQVIAAAGETFLAHEADTGHTSMGWDAASGALVGRALPGADAIRVALRVADLTLCLLGRSGAPLAQLGLEGRTLAEAYRWTAEAVETATGGAQARPLRHPGFELPDHPLARGGRLERDPGLVELARWFAGADAVLGHLARATRGAGPVLCWPHHFDIATLIAVELDRDGRALRTVGAGLSPGDGFVAEPYAYVNHWPATARRELPPLAAGEWFTAGWTGAVLRGGDLVAAGDAAAQEARLHAFFAAAVPVSRALSLDAAIR
jgi:hypothetical protein